MKVTITPQKVHVSIDPVSASIAVGTPIARDYVERDPYEGAYEITPSAETQILNTRNLRMTDNITVNPIPSNYGRIDYNGQYLVVS